MEIYLCLSQVASKQIRVFEESGSCAFAIIFLKKLVWNADGTFVSCSHTIPPLRYKIHIRYFFDVENVYLKIMRQKNIAHAQIATISTIRAIKCDLFMRNRRDSFHWPRKWSQFHLFVIPANIINVTMWRTTINLMKWYTFNFAKTLVTCKSVIHFFQLELSHHLIVQSPTIKKSKKGRKIMNSTSVKQPTTTVLAKFREMIKHFEKKISP